MVDVTQGSQTDTKRLQRSSAFSLGCEDQDATTEKEKLLVFVLDTEALNYK